MLQAWIKGTVATDAIADMFEALSEIFPDLRNLSQEVRKRTLVSKVLVLIVILIVLAIHFTCQQDT